MSDERPFDETKIVAELVKLGYEITAAAFIEGSEFFARIGKWRDDISGGYLVPNHPTILCRGNTYQFAIDCHTEHTKNVAVTVTLKATYIGNGEFRIECGNVVLLPDGNREVFIPNVARELHALALDRDHALPSVAGKFALNPSTNQR